MFFNPPDKIITEKTFSFLGKPLLELVKEFCYFGIPFSMSGSFTHIIRTIRDKVNKVMDSLIDTAFKYILGVTASMNLFDKLTQLIALHSFFCIRTTS